MWMMGSSLNPSSVAAREMDMVLKSEVTAHAAYDPMSKPSYHGVPVPGRKKVWKSPKISSLICSFDKFELAEIVILNNESRKHS